jgi:hypothetical protein
MYCFALPKKPVPLVEFELGSYVLEADAIMTTAPLSQGFSQKVKNILL